MVMIFFSLNCYKQYLVSLRRLLARRLQGVKHRLLMSAAPAAMALVHVGGVVNLYIVIGWSGDRHRGPSTPVYMSITQSVVGD